MEDHPAITALLQHQGERPAGHEGVTVVQREARGRERQIHGQGPHAYLVDRYRPLLDNVLRNDEETLVDILV